MQVSDLVKKIEKINDELEDAVNNPELSFDEGLDRVTKWLEFMKQEVKLID